MDGRERFPMQRGKSESYCLENSAHFIPSDEDEYEEIVRSLLDEDVKPSHTFLEMVTSDVFLGNLRKKQSYSGEQWAFLFAVFIGDTETVKTYFSTKGSNVEVLYRRARFSPTDHQGYNSEHIERLIDIKTVKPYFSTKGSNVGVLYRRAPISAITGHQEYNNSEQIKRLPETHPLALKGLKARFTSKDFITDSLWLEAVIIAHNKRHADVLSLLFRDDRFYQESNENGQNILYQAMNDYLAVEYCSQKAEIIDILLKPCKFRANVLNVQSETILEIVCKAKPPSTRTLNAQMHPLLNKGKRVNLKFQTVRLLEIISHNGIDLNGRNKTGETLLMLACENERIDIVRSLLNLTLNAFDRFRLDIDAVDYSSETALMKAKRNNDLQIVGALQRFQFMSAVEEKSNNAEMAAMIEQSLLLNAIKNDDLETLENVLFDNRCLLEIGDDNQRSCTKEISMTNGFGRSNPANYWNILQRIVAGHISPRIKSKAIDLIEMLVKSKRFDARVLTSSSQNLLHLLCLRPLNRSLRFFDENDEIAKVLIKNGVDYNQRDDRGKTPLMVAYENGHQSVLHFLVASEWETLEMDAADSSGESVFTIAGRNKDHDILTWLTSALFWQAVSVRNMNMVTRFSNCSTEVYARRLKGLCVCPIKSRFLIDSLIFELQSDPIIVDDKSMVGLRVDDEHPAGSCIAFSAWFFAIIVANNQKHEPMVQLLLRFEKLVCGITRDGFTALHLAMLHCQLIFTAPGLSIFEILIKSGRFDVNALTNNQETVLHFACRCKDVNQVELLLELLLRCNVNVNQRNYLGQTALMVACKSENVVAVRELLKWKDPDGEIVDINAKDDAGQTALSLAYQSNKAELAILMEQAILSIAIEYVDLETVENAFTEEFLDGNKEPCAKKMKMIIDTGKDLLAEEWSIFQRFFTGNVRPQIKSERVDLVQILLKSGKFDVNTLTSSSQNILHLLCHCRMNKSKSDFAENCKIATLLIEDGIDFNKKDTRGRTPLMLACEHGNDSVVETLLLWEMARLNIEAYEYAGDSALSMTTCNTSDDAVDAMVKSKRIQLDIDAYDNSGESALVKSAKIGNNKAFSTLSSVIFLQSVKQNDMEAVKRFLNSSREECARCFKDLCVHPVAIGFMIDCLALDWQLQSCLEPDIGYPSGSCVNFNAWLNAVKIAYDCKYDSLLDLLFIFEEEVSEFRRDGLTALHLTVFHCQSQFGHKALKAFEILMKSNRFDVNALSSNLETVMHFACRYRNSENAELIIELILKYKVKVNQRNISGQTALMIACKNQNTVAVHVLLKWEENYVEKLDVDAIDNEGQTSLSIAQQLKNTKIEAMIEQKLFLRAVESGDIETVKSYMTRLNENGQTEQHPMNMHRPTAEFLQKSPSNRSDSQSETVNSESQDTYESESNRSETIADLSNLNEATSLREGTIFDEFRFNSERDEVQSKSVNFITHSVFLEAIYMAICNSKYENSHSYILKLLLCDDDYVRTSNEDGQTVLHSAVKEFLENKCEIKGFVKIVLLLRLGNCDVNSLNSQKETVLHLACNTAPRANLVLDKLLSILHDYRVDLNHKNSLGKTALLIACENENVSIVRILLNLTGNTHNIHPDDDTCDKYADDKTMSYWVQLIENERFRQMIRSSNCNLKDDEDKWRTIYAFDFETWREATNVAIKNSCDEILNLLFDYDVIVQCQHGILGEPILTWCIINDAARLDDASSDLCFKLYKKLIESGKINVNAINFQAETVLYYKLYKGVVEDDVFSKLIDLLFLHGANVNQKDKHGQTAIVFHCDPGISDRLKHILNCAKKTGAALDVDAKDAFGRTALMYAALWKDSNAVEMLLNAGASVNLSDHRGFTALHHALYEFMSLETWISFDDFPRNTAELRKRMEVNIDLYENDKPYHVYERNRTELNADKTKTVKLLLEKDVNVNALDFEGYSPLDIAEASIPQIPSLVKNALKTKGAILNVFENETQQSQCNSDLNFSRFILHRRSSLLKVYEKEIKGRFNDTEDKLAAKKFFKLDSNIQMQLISERDQRGRTPLHCAVISGQQTYAARSFNLSEVIKTVEMLISFGCGVNEADIYGRTPLHYADSTELEKLLLSKGADPEIIDKDGIKATELSKTLQDKRTTLVDYREDSITRIIFESVHDIGPCHLNYMQNGTIEMFAGFYDSDNYEKWEKDYSPEITIGKQCRNANYASVHPSVEQVKKEVTDFMQNLASELKKRDCRFEVTPKLVGSSHEETRLNLPDEFDFSFVLTQFSRLCEVSQSPELPTGFVHLKRKLSDIDKFEGKEYDGFFNDNFMLIVERVYVRFKHILTKVLKDPQFIGIHQEFDWDLETRAEDLVPWVSLSEFVTTLNLRKTKLDLSKRSIVDISIDIVPCIHIPGWWPDEAITNVSDRLKMEFGCKLVFQRPQKSFPWVPYSEMCAMISFAPVESEMIRMVKNDDRAKQAYLIGKQLIKKSHHLIRITDPDFDIRSTSYIVKNSFLYCIEALKTTFDYATECDLGLSQNAMESKLLQLWLESLMKCHLDFLSQDFCPSYFMPNLCIPTGEYLKEFHMKCFTNCDVKSPMNIVSACQLYRYVSLYASRLYFKSIKINPVFEHFNREPAIANLRASAIKNLEKAVNAIYEKQ